MHLRRKGQMQGGGRGAVTGQVLFIASLFGVAASADQPARRYTPRVAFEISCNRTTWPALLHAQRLEQLGYTVTLMPTPAA